ncbi:hypothetical protein Ancab_023082 [Ancistrocladus abbreviatus]
MDPVEDKEGFFIALFVRERNCPGVTSRTSTASSLEIGNDNDSYIHCDEERPFCLVFSLQYAKSLLSLFPILIPWQPYGVKMVGGHDNLFR